MANERFPKRKYLKQLRGMRYALSEWRREYQLAERDTTTAWLAGSYAGRAACLELTIAALDQAFTELEGLPRLS